MVIWIEHCVKTSTESESSLMDELLGRLVAELGKEHFRKKIRVVNISDHVRRTANVVITQRLDMD